MILVICEDCGKLFDAKKASMAWGDPETPRSGIFLLCSAFGVYNVL